MDSLEQALAQALVGFQSLAQVRPEVLKATQEMLADPEMQVLMERLAQAEAQEQVQVEDLDWLAQGRLTDL